MPDEEDWFGKWVKGGENVVKPSDQGQWWLDFRCTKCGFPLRRTGYFTMAEQNLIRDEFTCPNCGLGYISEYRR